MKVWRVGSVVVLCAFGVFSMAKVAFQKDFQGTYGVKKSTFLGKANCGVCHVGTAKKLNPYGVDLQKAMTQENTKVLTGSVLKKVEGLDSNNDGKSNLEEIQGATLPGDGKSK